MAALVRHVRLVGKSFIHRGKTSEFVLTQRLPVCCLHSASQRTFSKLHNGGQLTVRMVGGPHTKHLASQLGLRHNPHVLCSVAGLRWNSTGAPGTNESSSSLTSTLPEGYIPEPPSLPDSLQQTLLNTDVNALGEPTLQAMGLGSMAPSGIVQQALEMLHCGVGIPWWGSIIIGTVFVRLCMFPLVILAQRNSANMSNHMPTVQKLQEKFSQARMSGNAMDAARSAYELQDYMKRNNVKPGRAMMVPMAQVPVFLSVFVGLRQMANLPVDSMRTGGLLWFTDLTVPDPFYLMPLMTMATFLLTIELGVDGMKANTMTHTVKWIMRGMPIIVLPLIINFPAAMLVYWFTSNAFSLTQVMFLKIPGMRSFFKIPDLVIHPKEAQKPKKKFIEGFKETWDNSKLMAKVEDRQRMEAARFKEAGTGPLVKTYSYDPTKVGKEKVKAKRD